MGLDPTVGADEMGGQLPAVDEPNDVGAADPKQVGSLLGGQLAGVGDEVDRGPSTPRIPSPIRSAPAAHHIAISGIGVGVEPQHSSSSLDTMTGRDELRIIERRGWLR